MSKGILIFFPTLPNLCFCFLEHVLQAASSHPWDLMLACRKHPTEPFEHYCMPCMKPLCKECFNTHNQSHCIIGMELACRENREYMKYTFHFAMAKQRDLENAQRIIEAQRVKLKEEYLEALDKIDTAEKICIAEVKQKANADRQLLSKSLEHRCSELDHAMLRVQRDRQVTTNVSNFVARYMSEGSNEELMLCREKILRLLLKVDEPFFETIFKPFELKYVADLEAIKRGVQNLLGHVFPIYDQTKNKNINRALRDSMVGEVPVARLSPVLNNPDVVPSIPSSASLALPTPTRPFNMRDEVSRMQSSVWNYPGTATNQTDDANWAIGLNNLQIAANSTEGNAAAAVAHTPPQAANLPNATGEPLNAAPGANAALGATAAPGANAALGASWYVENAMSGQAGVFPPIDTFHSPAHVFPPIDTFHSPAHVFPPIDTFHSPAQFMNHPQDVFSSMSEPPLGLELQPKVVVRNPRVPLRERMEYTSKFGEFGFGVGSVHGTERRRCGSVRRHNRLRHQQQPAAGVRQERQLPLRDFLAHPPGRRQPPS